MEELLKVTDLSVNYCEKAALNKIAVTVHKKEVVVIVGESGSGKTTLLKSIIGGLPRESDFSGQILFAGQNLIEMEAGQLRQLRGAQIGMVFQNSQSALCPVRKIGVQLYESVRQHQNVTKKQVYEMATELFSVLQLEDSKRILNSYPFELSGGMNQRVGVAMAMIMKPDLLLADEPVSALDDSARQALLKMLMELKERFGSSILLVTHDLSVASYLGNRMLVMKDGCIIEEGSVPELLKNPKQEYTKKLIQAAPEFYIGG